MNREEIQQTVTEIVADVMSMDVQGVTPLAHIENDLGGTSMDQVEVVMEVEKEYRISIPDEAAERLHSVKELTDYIYQKL